MKVYCIVGLLAGAAVLLGIFAWIPPGGSAVAHPEAREFAELSDYLEY